VILVLGGGIAGLAAAGVLRDAGMPCAVLEKEAEPGGLCRSIAAGGYAFDMSGHFLHVSDPSMRDFLLGRDGVAWSEVARDARVWLRGRLTPYPFQVHLYGHDRGFVERCLRDFAAARIEAAVRGAGSPKTFAEWLLGRFGREMCRAFFFPYNRKMWRTPLSRMDFGWTGWSVPVPAFEDLLAGARGERRDGLGYNATFFYPREGGIASLVRALARPVLPLLRTGERVARIDLARRTVATARGERIPYEAVVSTVPLPELSSSAAGLSAPARRTAASLSWVKVLAINMGVRRPARTPGHWVYVPERAYPFFRAGFLSNVSPAAAPAGCASLFVEKSFPAGARIDVGKEVEAAVSGLRSMGILTGRSRIEEIRPLVLDPAYVILDAARAAAVPVLRRELAGRGVFPAGRYGAWDYFGMAASVADGMRAAREAMHFLGK
jgi:protoporphyrinogen oxidase